MSVPAIAQVWTVWRKSPGVCFQYEIDQPFSKDLGAIKDKSVLLFLHDLVHGIFENSVVS